MVYLLDLLTVIALIWLVQPLNRFMFKNLVLYFFSQVIFNLVSEFFLQCAKAFKIIATHTHTLQANLFFVVELPARHSFWESMFWSALIAGLDILVRSQAEL